MDALVRHIRGKVPREGRRDDRPPHRSRTEKQRKRTVRPGVTGGSVGDNDEATVDANSFTVAS